MTTPTRKPMNFDHDHMRLLHEECFDQLELMAVTLDAVGNSPGCMRDKLCNMVTRRWDCYLDIMHMIAKHDERMNHAMQCCGLKFRQLEDEPENPRYFNPNFLLLSPLFLGLGRHHRRFIRYHSFWRGPMNDFWKGSMEMEREHLAQMIAYTQEMM